MLCGWPDSWLWALTRTRDSGAAQQPSQVTLRSHHVPQPLPELFVSSPKAHRLHTAPEGGSEGIALSHRPFRLEHCVGADVAAGDGGFEPVSGVGAGDVCKCSLKTRQEES